MEYVLHEYVGGNILALYECGLIDDSCLKKYYQKDPDTYIRLYDLGFRGKPPEIYHQLHYYKYFMRGIIKDILPITIKNIPRYLHYNPEIKKERMVYFKKNTPDIKFNRRAYHKYSIKISRGKYLPFKYYRDLIDMGYPRNSDVENEAISSIYYYRSPPKKILFRILDDILWLLDKKIIDDIQISYCSQLKEKSKTYKEFEKRHEITRIKYWNIPSYVIDYIHNFDVKMNIHDLLLIYYVDNKYDNFKEYILIHHKR